MFGLNTITMWIMGAMVVAILAASGVAWYFKSEYAEALEDKGKVEAALEVQKAATKSALDAVDAWKKSAEGFQLTLGELTKAQREATKETRRLNDVFSQHDLGELAKRKPGLIENRVNTGTSDMLRMLERASAGNGTPRDSNAGSKANTTGTSSTVSH